MSDLHVRIERLRPMRVAWVNAFGAEPEQEAWERLRAWAAPAGVLDGAAAHPVFGFNDPPAAPGAAQHGYELWIGVEAGTLVPEGIGVRDFEGGLYAVTPCRLGPDMPAAWKALLRWVHASPYAWRRSAHELERFVDPLAAEEDAVVDLCLPIEEPKAAIGL